MRLGDHTKMAFEVIPLRSDMATNTDERRRSEPAKAKSGKPALTVEKVPSPRISVGKFPPSLLGLLVGT